MPEEVFQEDAQALRKELANALERVLRLEIALTVLAHEEPVGQTYEDELRLRREIAAKALRSDDL